MLEGPRLRRAVEVAGVGRVVFRPLTPGELAELRSRDLGDRALAAAVVARAALRPEGGPIFGSEAEAAGIDAGTLDAFSLAWSEVQRLAYPSIPEESVPEVQRAVREHGSPALDAVRAIHARKLCAFYGIERSLDATDWQVYRFLTLMNRG